MQTTEETKQKAAAAAAALASGEKTIEQVAAETGWPVIDGCVVPEPEKWHADDGNAEVIEEHPSGRAAAQSYVDGGDWGENASTTWIKVYVWRVGIDADGDKCRVNEAHHMIAIEPPEPDCIDGEDHDWQSSQEIVGGIAEAPGVERNDGGVIIRAACMRCGCGRTTNSWATNPETGESGLDSVSYEPGKYAAKLRKLRAQMTYTELRGHITDLTDTGLTVDESDQLMRWYTATEIDRIANILSEIAEIATDGDGTSQYDLAIAAHRNPSRKAGELVFWEHQSLRDDARWHDLAGWPECECVGCCCSDPATTTDESSIPVCAACSDYTVDSDGDVHCSNMDDVEVVTESCGAGNQTRSYVRLKPPEMPAEDADGEWACYWDTVGDDSHVVSRHSSREEAEQAVAAHDFPRSGDHTHYLCGYGVRELVDGKWVHPEGEIA